jgi:hypothetical protein
MGIAASRFALIGPLVHAALLWLIWLLPPVSGVSKYALMFGSLLWFIWPIWILSAFRDRAHIVSLLISFIAVMRILLIAFALALWSRGGFAP